jgi:hypothetical protein
MSVTSATKMKLERLGFSVDTAAYFTRECGIESLGEIAYLDGDGDVENTIKGVASLGGTVTVGTGTSTVTSRNNGIPVPIRDVENLKLCVYYLKHLERVECKPVPTAIDLELVHSYHDQQIYEASFKKIAEEPVINDKDWHRTLENIKGYLASQYGETGATFDYVVRPEITVKSEAEDPAEDNDTVDQKMTARALHSGQSFVNDRRKVWDIMSNICGKHSCFVHNKPALHTKNGRDAYMLLFDHFLGQNNVVNMASAAKIKLTGTLYNGENNRFTWDMYVWIHMEHHSVVATTREKGSIDAATLAKNWGIRIEAAERTRIVTTQRGIQWMIHPSLTKRLKTNDSQLRYHRLPITMYTDTMYSTIASRTGHKAAQVFCTGNGWIRAFPMKKEKEAHEALSLLFHRDGVPNVMVMEGAKAQFEGKFRCKLSDAGCHIKQTETYTASSNMGEVGVRELKKGVGRQIIRSGCPKPWCDDCIVREAYVCSHTALDIFGLEGHVPESRVKGEHADISEITE